MKFAYADPPYFGQGKKLYAKEHPEAHVWDTIEAYAALIKRLCLEYPDGWVLSCSSPSLRRLLPLCPETARIGAWTKPFCIFKPHVGVAYAWEPFIFLGGRKRTREQPTIRDWVSCNILIKKGLTGAKPEGFSTHLFEILNAMPGDTLDDLFPGTGLVTQAWKTYLGKRRAEKDTA